MAQRPDAAGHRHRRPREPRCAAGARDRIGASGPHAHRAAHRCHGAGLEVVADARALNVWRRWGYGLLPGDVFSYVLHLRPAEWPIMAGHTLLGYVLAVGLGGAWSGERLLPALLALGVWVIFLNGGTLAINSVFDKDEGDIGYLNAPPPLPRHLLAFSVALLAGGLLLGLRASLGVAIACTALAFALLGWAAAVLDVPAWLLAVPFVAWLAVLLPWYRRREMLSAGGHQRGMYRALVAWAVTDLVVLLVFAR